VSLEDNEAWGLTIISCTFDTNPNTIQVLFDFKLHTKWKANQEAGIC
jgi:hypothetical protein